MLPIAYSAGIQNGGKMEIENKYRTSRGVEVEFLSIAVLLDKFQSAHKPPPKPTYKLKNALGADEEHELDEKSLTEKPDQFTPEQHAAWQAYLVENAKATDEYNRALTRLLLMRGIVVEIPKTDEWVKQQEWLGITVPADPMERRLHYIETEVMGSVADYERVTLGVMSASGVSENLLKQVEDSFRGRVGGDTAEATAPAEKQMASHDKIRTRTHRV